MSEQLQIPVELEVEAVKRYVMGETLTPYNFDLLQNYFEGRIIKLLESYEGWKTVMEHDSDSILESVIALIKGENK